MAQSYNRLRETTFDLYVERDALSAYFRFITLSSTWLIFVGYILFALSFSTSDEHLKTSRGLLVALASALLIVGYLAAGITAFFSRSLLFLIDSALYPLVTTSLMGVFITALTFAIDNNRPVSRVYMAVPLITSAVTTAVAAIALGLVYMEVNKITSRDERRRWHVALHPHGGELQPMQLPQRLVSQPEDDAQRRQLLRLLQERHEQPNVENMRGTYKIDLPGEQRAPTVPWNALQPPRQRFQLSNLLPWNNGALNTFKDARERRRDEIERSGMPLNTDSANHPTLHQRGLSRDVMGDVQHGQSNAPIEPQSSWGWPPATRYA